MPTSRHHGMYIATKWGLAYTRWLNLILSERNWYSVLERFKAKRILLYFDRIYTCIRIYTEYSLSRSTPCKLSTNSSFFALHLNSATPPPSTGEFGIYFSVKFNFILVLKPCSREILITFLLRTGSPVCSFVGSTGYLMLNIVSVVYGKNFVPW